MSEEFATIQVQENQAEYAKADLVTRVIASLIDGLLQYIAVVIIGVIFGLIAGIFGIASAFVRGIIGGIIGSIAGAVYMLLKDGLFEGQSIGKKAMKLQVVELSGKKTDFTVSVKRNAIFALPGLLSLIPNNTVRTIGGLLALAILIYEIYNVYSDPKGCRLGDKLANTQVIPQK